MLTSINETLTAVLGPLGPLVALGFLGLVLVAATLPVMLKKRADPYAKLRGATVATASQTPGKQAKKSLRQGRGSEKLDKFATFLEPKTEEEMSTSRLKMTRAGYRGRDAVRKFHAVQFMLGIFFLICGVIYAIVASATGEISTTTLLLAVLKR